MINALAENIWTAAKPFSMMGLQFGAQMAVVKLNSGDLFLYSPIKLDAELKKALDALGPVKFILAPNRMHHMFIADYTDQYPQAEVIGVRGLDSKRRDIKFNRLLDENAAEPIAEEISHYCIAGAPTFNEVVCYHRPSKTLMVCDLLMNLQPPLNLLTRIYIKMFGKMGEPAVPKVVRLSVKDRQQFKESIEPILALDVERIVMGHGQPITSDGKRILRDSLSWLR